jgi:2-polyprenyl-3-methyl-5-hydroxy-6-metoxy-1,4-benzoquinol methylase
MNKVKTIEQLWDELRPFLEQRIHSCLVCGSNDFSLWAQEKYLKSLRCNFCSMISVNPHFTEQGLDYLYSEYFQVRQSNALLNAQRDITYEIDRDWICRHIEKGKVLDVGCSGGFFLNKFNSDKWERYGVEISKDAAKHACDTFGIPVLVGNVLDIKNESYDLIMMRGVIEHFKNPIKILEACSKLLKPGGRLFITATPNGNAFAFDVYREKWQLFTPLEHIHFFSVNNLSSVLENYSMALEDHHYQYEETPYANIKKDYRKIKDDIASMANGNNDQVDSSCPFPGSMISAVWIKK